MKPTPTEVVIKHTAYFDTPTEQCRLLRAGDLVTPFPECSEPPPCHSKLGYGAWYRVLRSDVTEHGRTVFIEHSNIEK